MPIEISNFFNDVNTSVFNIVGLNRIFSSVIYTSMLLTVLVMIVVIFIYPYKKNTATYVFFKSFLYILIVITIVLALHSNFVRTYYRSKYKDDGLDTFVDKINGGNYSDDMIKIEPAPAAEYDDGPHGGDHDSHESGDYMQMKHNSVSDILDSINI